MATSRTDRHSAFATFLQESAAAFDTIVRAAGGAVALHELHSEAWLVAADIEAKRGTAVNFCALDDQQLVIRWVKANLKFSRRGRPRTLSLNQTLQIYDDGDRITWLSILAAPENSDPLAWILGANEEDIDWFALARETYSELSAYILLLIRYSWERDELARGLAISTKALQTRIVRAADVYHVQPSIFDRIDFIDPDFSIRPASRRCVRSQSRGCKTQQALF